MPRLSATVCIGMRSANGTWTSKAVRAAAEQPRGSCSGALSCTAVRLLGCYRKSHSLDPIAARPQQRHQAILAGNVRGANVHEGIALVEIPNQPRHPGLVAIVDHQPLLSREVLFVRGQLSQDEMHRIVVASIDCIRGRQHRLGMRVGHCYPNAVDVDVIVDSETARLNL